MREPGQGRDPGRLELHHLAAPDAGDAAEAVGRVPPGVAERQEVADPAGVAGVGPGLAAVRDERLEPRVDAARVGGELAAGGSSAARRSRAARGSSAGSTPWIRGELLAVEAELEDVGGLRVAGELGVDRLVGAVGLPLEKVGLPAPAPVRRARPGRRRRPRSGSPPRSRQPRDPSRSRARARSRRRSCPRRAAGRGRPPRARAPCETRARPARCRTAA